MKSIIILRFSCHLKTDIVSGLEIHFSSSNFFSVFIHTQMWQELWGIHVTGEHCDGKLQKVPTLLLLLRPWRRAEECDINQTVQLQCAVPLPLLAHMHDDWWGRHCRDGKADSIPFPPLWENPKDQQIKMKTSLRFKYNENTVFSFFTKEP